MLLMDEDTGTAHYGVEWMQENACHARDRYTWPSGTVIDIHREKNYVPLGKSALTGSVRRIGMFYGATPHDFLAAEIIEERANGDVFYRALTLGRKQEAEREIRISTYGETLCPLGSAIGSKAFFKKRADREFLTKLFYALKVPVLVSSAASLHKERRFFYAPIEVDEEDASRNFFILKNLAPEKFPPQPRAHRVILDQIMGNIALTAHEVLGETDDPAGDETWEFPSETRIKLYKGDVKGNKIEEIHVERLVVHKMTGSERFLHEVMFMNGTNICCTAHYGGASKHAPVSITLKRLYLADPSEKFMITNGKDIAFGSKEYFKSLSQPVETESFGELPFEYRVQGGKTPQPISGK